MADPDLDVLVVGAGFAGLFALHRLRRLGLRVAVVEAGAGVGGTWYWNRYPGARCDIESAEYSYQFSEELQQEWDWSERYASQPEILRYLNHVADRFDLRSDIYLNARVESAHWNEAIARWQIRIPSLGILQSRWLIMATGCLSKPNKPQVTGLETFGGSVFHTGLWPHDPVDLAGKRIGIIGTGSSAVQAIPELARQAAHLHVFQRTATYAVPAHNRPLDPAAQREVKKNYAALRALSNAQFGGANFDPNPAEAMQTSELERERVFGERWARGGLPFMAAFADLVVDSRANAVAAEYVRTQIRRIVRNPGVAELLSPRHTFACKRLCVDSGYYDTFNRSNVTLVDARATPVERITPEGLQTTAAHFELDTLVFATGFDAMTGALLAIDIRGRDGIRLAEAWQAGPKTYLGVATNGFPNLFTVSGPGSPSVLSNMVATIEQHINWIADCIGYLAEHAINVIEAAREAQDDWVTLVNALAAPTLLPSCNSWYLGANIPGKPRVFMPYSGGFPAYRQKCQEVAASGYAGFLLSAEVLMPVDSELAQMLVDMNGPPLREVPLDLLRSGSPIPALPSAAVFGVEERRIAVDNCDFGLRIYRPRAESWLPALVYFHGGGFVLGGLNSHDSLLRQIALEGDCVVVSVDYRLAPEHRFPAAVHDAVSSVRWVHAHAAELRIDTKRIFVGGDSAGGNLAAVTTLQLRDDGEQFVLGQILVYPVTRLRGPLQGSLHAFREGYFLRTDDMTWFEDCYLGDGQDQNDWHASPLLSENLNSLPPSWVITAEFDPLLDQGAAYARKLTEAGNDCTYTCYAGAIHGFFGMPAAISRQSISDATGWLSRVAGRGA